MRKRAQRTSALGVNLAADTYSNMSAYTNRKERGGMAPAWPSTYVEEHFGWVSLRKGCAAGNITESGNAPFSWQRSSFLGADHFRLLCKSSSDSEITKYDDTYPAKRTSAIEDVLCHLLRANFVDEISVSYFSLLRDEFTVISIMKFLTTTLSEKNKVGRGPSGDSMR